MPNTAHDGLDRHAAELAGSGQGAPLALEVGWIAGVCFCYAGAILVTQPGRVDRLTQLEGRGRAGTLFAAFWIVRHGCAFVPAARSLPVGDTKNARPSPAQAVGAAPRVTTTAATTTMHEYERLRVIRAE